MVRVPKCKIAEISLGYLQESSRYPRLGDAMPSSSEEQHPLRGGLFMGQRSPSAAAWQEDFFTQSGGLLREAINESVLKVG